VIEVPETVPAVQVDPALLERAVANVVANAVSWAPEGSVVRVEAGEVGQRVHLRVIDRGPGVAAQDRRRVMEPFQRLGDRSTQAGVGLGLAVPVNATTLGIVAALMRDGRVRRAYLGVVGGRRPLAPRHVDAIGQAAGIGVVEVAPGSPAARAGVQPTDTIVSVDGVPTESAGDLQRLMVADAIGRPLRLQVLRSGRVETIEVVPAELT